MYNSNDKTQKNWGTKRNPRPFSSISQRNKTRVSVFDFKKNNTEQKTGTPNNNEGARNINSYKKFSGNKTPIKRSFNTNNRNETTRTQGNFSNFKRNYHRPTQNKTIQKNYPISHPSSFDGNSIRIIPLGGVEEIGKNMTAIEIGNDILVIDAGLQMSNQETPGIDYTIPNTKYLEERKSKIRGIVITHGHLDHIGGIPYVIEKLGYPSIYSREITTIMIKKKQEEFPHLKTINYEIIEKEDKKIKIGNLQLRFFGVSHSIPDSMGIIIETEHGNIICTGDVRVNNVNGIPTKEEEDTYTKLGQEKNLLLLADSTNAENAGFSLPEKVVLDNIEQIIKDATGRLIIGTFASQLERTMDIIRLLEKHGKKVVIEGRSMKNNIEIVKKMGLLKIRPETIIPVEEMEKYPHNKIVVIATGSQGEEFAALMRMASKTHKYLKIKKGDLILLSSSIIPGNELGVQKIKDNLSRQGAKIISYRISQVHASGHANGDELLWVHKQIKPKFFIPIHGYHYMLSVHADIAKKAGTKEENIIIPDNGSIIEIQDKGEKIITLKEKAPSNLVMVDGFSIGDEQEVVIRDRMALAQDGIYVIIAAIDSKNGKLRKSPDLISRGFIHLKENQDLLNQSRIIIKKTIEETTAGTYPFDFDTIKSTLIDNISRFLYQKTAKKPLVIPVIVSV